MEINSLEDYQKLALVTKSDTEGPYYDFRHGALGVSSEVGEILSIYKATEFYKKPLDVVNLKEEIGDCLWFASLLYYALSIPMDIDPEKEVEGLTDPSLDTTLSKITHYSSVLCCMALARKEECMEANLDYDVRNFVIFLYYLCKLNGFSLLEIAEDNIKKLMKRYPNGYSQYNALHRDKDNELSHIGV